MIVNFNVMYIFFLKKKLCEIWKEYYIQCNTNGSMNYTLFARHSLYYNFILKRLLFDFVNVTSAEHFIIFILIIKILVEYLTCFLLLYLIYVYNTSNCLILISFAYKLSIILFFVTNWIRICIHAQLNVNILYLFQICKIFW